MRKNGKKVVHSCYRAVGRVLGFCYLKEFHMSSIVLSKIHRNYLLRGLTPQSAGYDVSDLFYDLKESMGRKGMGNEQMFANLQAMLDDDDDDKDKDDKNDNKDKNKVFATELRNLAQKYYITPYKFFLDAISDGMRVGKFCCLGVCMCQLGRMLWLQQHLTFCFL